MSAHVGQLVARVRSGAADAVDVLTLPAAHDFRSGEGTITIGAGGGVERIAYLQWQPSLPPGTEVRRAVLRLAPTAAQAGSVGTHTVRLLDWFAAPLAAGVVAAAQLGSQSGPPDGWAWGVPPYSAEYEITELVSAALANPGYSAGSFVTLSLGCDENPGRTFWAWDGDRSRAAELLIDFVPAADPNAERCPYELMIRAFWDLLESSPELAGMVAPGNRVKFLDRPGDPVKREVSSADLPEVRIVYAGSTPQTVRTSSSGSTVERFEIQVSTGEWRMEAVLLPLKWAVFRALSKWRSLLGGEGVIWRGVDFIKNVTVRSTSEGRTEGDLRRGIDGWATIWSIEVECWFPLNLL